MESLDNKLCLVTGGTRGIGNAIARMLLAEGANVAICGRNPEAVAAAVAALPARPGRKVAGIAADVSDQAQVNELFRFVDGELGGPQGGLDVLVNNAGVGLFGHVGEITVEDWRRTVETNLFGTFYCCRLAVPRFGTRGGGAIVNISSLAGANAFAGGAAYNASKFGLNGMSEAMMQDLRTQNVRVSTIMPGSVATEFGRVPGTAHENRAQSGGDGSDWKIWPDDVAEIVRTVLRMPARTCVSRVEVRPSRPKR